MALPADSLILMTISLVSSINLRVVRISDLLPLLQLLNLLGSHLTSNLFLLAHSLTISYILTTRDLVALTMITILVLNILHHSSLRSVEIVLDRVSVFSGIVLVVMVQLR